MSPAAIAVLLSSAFARRLRLAAPPPPGHRAAVRLVMIPKDLRHGRRQSFGITSGRASRRPGSGSGGGVHVPGTHPGVSDLVNELPAVGAGGLVAHDARAAVGG